MKLRSFHHSALELMIEVRNYNIGSKPEIKQEVQESYFGNVWKNLTWNQYDSLMTTTAGSSSMEFVSQPFVYHSMWNTVGGFLLAVLTVCNTFIIIYLPWTFAAKHFSLQCLWLSGVKCIIPHFKQHKLHVNFKWNRQLIQHIAKNILI